MTEIWRCRECWAIIDDEHMEVIDTKYHGRCPYCGEELTRELDTEGMWPDEDTDSRFRSFD